MPKPHWDTPGKIQKLKLGQSSGEDSTCMRRRNLKKMTLINSFMTSPTQIVLQIFGFNWKIANRIEQRKDKSDKYVHVVQKNTLEHLLQVSRTKYPLFNEGNGDHNQSCLDLVGATASFKSSKIWMFISSERNAESLPQTRDNFLRENIVN